VGDLDQSAKILIGGIFAGSLIYGLGVMNTARLQRRVQELQKACVAETEAQAKKQGTLSALATALTRTKGKFMGQDFTTQERATDVLVKKDGRWQVVFSQLTRFNKK
jgi:hypothetical protein